ncbi:MAG TPA: TetR/AcrR family transcriptional regulator [Actinomycetota bacterium]|nr:TetR/AcrR family transcriptional regulator [Actinomycetota bacterium]
MTRTGGEARRRRLLQEAIRLFGRHGYEGTSLEAVASAAGVRKQTLLYYFPTKEALLEACVAETSQRVAWALSEALEGEASPSQKAETVIHTLFRLAEEWPEFPQFVREAGRLGPEVVERFAAALEPLRLRALSFLARGMEEGQIRRQDPALLLFTLYTAVVGSITEAGVLRAVVGEDRGRLALHRREQEVLRFVRGALFAEGGARRERAARRA